MNETLNITEPNNTNTEEQVIVKPRLTSKNIFRTIANELGVDIYSKSRETEVIYGRAIAFKLSRELTKESFGKIGKNAKRDHATVMHAIKEFDNVYKYQKEPFEVLKYYNMFYREIQANFKVISDDYMLQKNTFLEENILLRERYESTLINLRKYKYKYEKLKLVTPIENSPFDSLVNKIPEEHVETVKVRLDAIIKMLPKKVSSF